MTREAEINYCQIFFTQGQVMFTKTMNNGNRYGNKRNIICSKLKKKTF